MEHLDPHELDIPRVDREGELCLNGVSYVLSTRTTTVWRYPAQYAMFDHLTINGDTGYRMFFGLTDDYYDQIAELGVTQVRPPYPSDSLIADFWELEMNDFDREIAEQENPSEEE